MNIYWLNGGGDLTEEEKGISTLELSGEDSYGWWHYWICQVNLIYIFHIRAHKLFISANVCAFTYHLSSKFLQNMYYLDAVQMNKNIYPSHNRTLGMCICKCTHTAQTMHIQTHMHTYSYSYTYLLLRLCFSSFSEGKTKQHKTISCHQ